MSRRLLSTRRLIPLDRLDDYLAGWNAVRAAAEAAGGRAWIFRGADHQDHFMEFVEWEEGAGPPLPERAEVATALGDLADRFGAGRASEWEEVTDA